VCAPSLPVVVIVHGNQEPHAWATILWDNAFAGKPTLLCYYYTVLTVRYKISRYDILRNFARKIHFCISRNFDEISQPTCTTDFREISRNKIENTAKLRKLKENFIKEYNEKRKMKLFESKTNLYSICQFSGQAPDHTHKNHFVINSYCCLRALMAILEKRVLFMLKQRVIIEK
jgi:hypothetical protein